MILNVVQILVTGFSGNEATLVFAMNGLVNTWNLRKYELKRQVLEFIFERDDSREKKHKRTGLCGNGTLSARTLSTELLVAIITEK